MTTPTHHPRRGRMAVAAAVAVVLVVAGLALFATAGPNRSGDPAQAIAGAPSSTTATPNAPDLPSLAGAAAGDPVSTPGSDAGAPSAPAVSVPSSAPGVPPAANGVPAPGTANGAGTGAVVPGQPGSSNGTDAGGTAPGAVPGAVVPDQPGSSGNAAPGDTPGNTGGATPGGSGNATPGGTGGGGSGVSDAARAAARAATPPTMPLNTLALPTLNVGPSPLGPICAEPGGILEPPANSIGMLCDWRGSASLDAGAGMTTLAGHINFNRLPNAAFARLSQMSPGDAIFTASPSGRVQAWVVTRRYELPKTQQLDAGAFAGPDGPRQLVLVSCGGALSGRSYLNNVYVDATPV